MTSERSKAVSVRGGPRSADFASRIGRGRTLTANEIGGVVTLVAIVALIPLVWSNGYALGVMITAMIVLVLNISWNFVLGIAGVWNFGDRKSVV